MAKERKDVPQNRKWNTDDIFASQKEWDDLYASLEGKLDFSAYKGKLKDAETILACMEGINAVVKDLSRLSVYAFMRRDEDTRNSEFDALQSRVQMLSMKFSAGVSFITPELTALPVEKLEELAADPRLKDYDYTIRGIIKDKPHVLSEEIETLLSQESRICGGLQDIFARLNNADLPYPTIRVNGEKVRLTHGTYGLMLHSPDRRVRRAAFKAFNKVYMDLINTITATFVGNIDKDVFLARTRKYNSCLEMALAGEDVDVQVYKNLLDSVNANLPLLHRYFKDRKKILGVKTLHMYDIYTSLVENAEIQVDYEEAFGIVKEGLAPLGEQYGKLLQEAHDNGWIDVEETEGKRSGAYSISVFGLKHPYVLLNYQKTTNDVFTVAHELGHAMHSYFSERNQPQEKASYKIFVAEVASTVNEVLLLKHLLKNTDDVKLKKYLLSYYMDTLKGTLFRGIRSRDRLRVGTDPSSVPPLLRVQVRYRYHFRRIHRGAYSERGTECCGGLLPLPVLRRQRQPCGASEAGRRGSDQARRLRVLHGILQGRTGRIRAALMNPIKREPAGSLFLVDYCFTEKSNV